MNELSGMTGKVFLLLIVYCLPALTGFSQTPFSKKLDSVFTSYLDSGFAGSVLVAEHHTITLQKAYGYANNETKTLNTINTLFNVASISKHFTVYAILKLEMEGRLRTEDYLSKYIGKFNDARDSITLHHLLIHRSGMIREGTELTYTTRSSFVASVKKGPPEAEPGVKYRYTNAGFSMLAAVVEIVSGKSFEEFLLKNIYEPCKMQNTGYPWEQRINKNLLATGYNSKRQPVAPQENIWAARGPGNLVTTMGDLFKWMEAFQDNHFLPERARQKILTAYFPAEDGYGWNKELTDRKTRFFHKGGGRSDFESRLMWFPDDEVIVIFSLNNDFNLARAAFNSIKSIMNSADPR